MNIDGQTRLLGLIGNPIAHTLSPLIHNALCTELSINEIYTPFLVEENAISKAIEGAYALNILGINVTVPYKSAVIPYLVSVDESAEAIGAVNTLVRVEGGYKGYNTDMLGLQMAIKQEKIELQNRDIIVLGAGGAARAVVYMCLLEHANTIWILNRTQEVAQKLAEHMNRIYSTNCVKALPLSNYHQLLVQDKSYIAFQTTSVGLAPNNSACILEDKVFYKSISVGIDIIYTPQETQFMRYVNEAGGKAMNGLQMLLYQAVIAYQLWNNLILPEKVIEKVREELCDKVYHEEKNPSIVLVGCMGAGKSTIGQALAEKWKLPFYDTDQLIEQSEKMQISRIFEEKGEQYFRSRETEILQQLLKDKKKAIIATGGGLPIRQQNQEILRNLQHVIYLKGSVACLCSHLEGCTDQRPLLRDNNLANRVEELLLKREEIYERVSNQIIHIDNQTVNEIIKKIEGKSR